MSNDDKILTKLDLIGNDIGEMKVTQAVHTTQLVEHMRRTELLEKRQEDLEEEIEPVTAHLHNLQGVKKLILIVSSILGLIILLGKVL